MVVYSRKQFVVGTSCFCSFFIVDGVGLFKTGIDRSLIPAAKLQPNDFSSLQNMFRVRAKYFEKLRVQPNDFIQPQNSCDVNWSLINGEQPKGVYNIHNFVPLQLKKIIRQ